MRGLITTVILIITIGMLHAGDDAPFGMKMPPPDEGGNSGFNFDLGVSAGAAVLDGTLYNQIGIRPLISIGKLGIALDLSLYMDADGNIRKENWNDAGDIFEKIYFVRWGHHGDPLYVKAGAIDHFRLGFGLLMNHYSNTIEYPSVIRTGLEFGVNTGRFSVDGMINDFGELVDGGGLLAGRVGVKLIGDLELGISAVYDVNQFKGLPDNDGDGTPDFADDFPDDANYQIDSDGDGVPDAIDPDRDGNGYTDNSQNPLVANNDPDIATIAERLKGEPFKVDEAANKSQIAFAADISYPFIQKKHLSLVAYSQYAQFGNGGGWGATAPGLRAKFAFINAYAEYRIFGKHFIPEYFNTTYELERAVVRGDSVSTKRDLLEHIEDQLKGYVIGADFDIANFLIFGAEYQNMSHNETALKTFRANLDVNASLIPKINKAGAYFYQENTELSDLFAKTEGTVLGYRLGYEIGNGASLVLDFRTTYRDKNGDGVISGSNEVVRTTQIQTVFVF